MAAKTIEELGKKTGAWTTTITYDPADINAKNLEQYDALFLSNTTGCFLDAKTTEPPASKDEVEARQAALVAFVRGGKGLGGIHATGDSYHSPCANDPGFGAGRRRWRPRRQPATARAARWRRSSCAGPGV